MWKMMLIQKTNNRLILTMKWSMYTQANYIPFPITVTVHFYLLIINIFFFFLEFYVSNADRIELKSGKGDE